VALSVLAMLAIMATSFITLTRLEVRITTNYVDDLRCDLLARGALSYFQALLRDDLDRTWGKYENRDTAVGAVGWQWSSTGGGIATRLPGMYTYKYGTAMCNDFWFNPPYKAWTDWGNLFSGEYTRGGVNQQSFSGNTGYSFGVPARYWIDDGAYSREIETWVGRTLCAWRNDGSKQVVHVEHPDHGAEIDFDGDGDPSPPCNGNSGAFREEESPTNMYFNTAPFILFSGNSFYHSGRTLTGEETLPGNLYWRWAVKLGIAHGTYINLNTAGNFDSSPAYLANIGGIGLRAARTMDETETYDHTPGYSFSYYDAGAGRYYNTVGPLFPSAHLGRLRWRGYDTDYEMATNGGYPMFYNEVMYHPSAVNLEKLFRQGTYKKRYNSTTSGGGFEWQVRGDRAAELMESNEKARELIAYRLGPDQLPGDGTDRYRVGWRPDGATYYKFESPEAPLGDGRFFGPNEVLEHDHQVDHADTSAIATIFTLGEWRRLKPYATMWSTDTILRGKIWPDEGGAPGNYTSAKGDWRHMDILKRVNINLLGAKGPDGLAGEDRSLKIKWAGLAAAERRRLYFMLLAAMRYTNVPSSDQTRRHQACQFVASLTDMVDRDRQESYFAAPDGSGEWAMGFEKHPVLNEVVFYARSANSENWQTSWLRVELYNGMENIPWIKDADEIMDIRNYRLKVNAHVYNIGDMYEYDRNAPAMKLNKVTTIQARGLWGKRRSDLTDDMNASDPEYNDSWLRYLCIGWGENFPGAIDKDEVKGGLTFSLWKPLDGSIAGSIAEVPGKVETLNGVKCICVDITPNLKLVPPLGPGAGPGGTETAFVGCYRRWDPWNGKNSGTPQIPTISDSQTTIRKKENSHVIWARGWGPARFGTLGKPNTDYPDLATRYNTGQWLAGGSKASPWRYRRCFERNVKVVDGDLPSVGWLGELIMHNAAQDGPLTWVHQAGQYAIHTGVTEYHSGSTGTTRGWKNQIDTRAKFDLFRPFGGVTRWTPQGEWNPNTAYCVTENLHVLDVFTVWDPTLDGIDNDGDGAIDEEDTGCQPGDKGGPEVRVFGRVDMNLAPSRVLQTVWPLNGRTSGTKPFCSTAMYGRMQQRVSEGGYGGWGPFDSIGDILRADAYTYRPGYWLAGGTSAWISGPTTLGEQGFSRFDTDPTTWNQNPIDAKKWVGDDDGDGVFDERDERDMIFTWVANHITTRSNVFEIDLVVDVCEPPFYPTRSDEARKLPFRAYKTNREVARKQIVGILDRSTCLRIRNGRCEFTGPVDVRMLRFSDEKRVH